VQELGLAALLFLLVASVFTSMIHGATGIAGGFLMAAAAALVLEVKVVIPVLSIALLISHSARALFNIKQFDKHAFLHIAIPALPFIVVAALIYGRLSNVMISLVLGTIVLLSIPLRRYANAWQLTPSNPALWVAGGMYGSIAGVAIGPGMLLMPVLMSLGLKKEAFVSTIAVIALTANITRASIYGFTDLLAPSTLLLGLLIGIATIPGAWIGRGILRRITDAKHIAMVEWLVVLGGLNFFWLAYKQL